MMLATVHDGTPDGELVVVSPDHERVMEAPVPTLQRALEEWGEQSGHLQRLAAELAGGGGEPLGHRRLAAPLPRSWQWLDGSAFINHGMLMERALGLAPLPTDLPLMYQGLSHQFLGPRDDVCFPSEADGIDFEGEFGVVTDFVPMGTSAQQALGHVKLIVQINDWSLRNFVAREMKTGFGWIQAKPACSAAAVAVSPDELGSDWRDGRVCLDLEVVWNGEIFGKPNGASMAFGFHELIAHAARTRYLPAGTIIGSGTVSNENYPEVGSACIAERRAIEMIELGAARTHFMRFGDRLHMEARSSEGRHLFGAIDQRVMPAYGPRELARRTHQRE